jgi:hypothetical protein
MANINLQQQTSLDGVTRHVLPIREVKFRDLGPYKKAIIALYGRKENAVNELPKLVEDTLRIKAR